MGQIVPEYLIHDALQQLARVFHFGPGAAHAGAGAANFFA